MKLKLKLSSKRIGGNKSDEQFSTIDNITKFYNSREEFMNLYNDWVFIIFIMVLKAVCDAKHGKGLKIWNPKQMLQKLTTVLYAGKSR